MRPMVVVTALKCRGVSRARLGRMVAQERNAGVSDAWERQVRCVPSICEELELLCKENCNADFDKTGRGDPGDR